jgi:hypothetical protein
MNPWQALGLGPTRDERAIKRAYTKLLREHPPETDPAGFQSLRQAYETATFLSRLPPGTVLKQAADGDETPGVERDAIEAGLVPPAAPAGTEAGEPSPPAARQETEPSWFPEAKALLERIAADFPDHSKRQFEAYWAGIIDAPVLWNLDAKGWVGWNLFGFLGRSLLDHRDRPTEAHIGREAWLRLDTAFGWSDGESSLYAAFPEDLADAVLDPIREARGLRRSVDLAAPPPRASDLADMRTNRSRSKYQWAVWPLGFLLFQIIKQCMNS